MDLIKIDKLLRKNGMEMKLEVNPRWTNAFFSIPEIMNGIYIEGIDNIQECLLDIPAVRERIVQKEHDESVKAAIALVERQGYRIEREAEFV